MILQSYDGAEFELNIVRGRQWNPQATSWQDYDWVSVYLRALASYGTFEDGGPYFLNRELLDLSSWLDDIARSKAVQSESRFIEGHVWFKIINQDERFVTVRVLFSTNYGWSYLKEVEPPYDETDFPFVDIETSRNQLQLAANQLREQYERLLQHRNS